MDFVARLRAENEELLERVRQLEEMLSPSSIEAPGGVYLTPQELKIYRCLSGRRVVSRNMIAAAVYAGRPDEIPNPFVVDVHLNRIRRKLRPLGIRIVNQWGAGWQMVAPETEEC